MNLIKKITIFFSIVFSTVSVSAQSNTEPLLQAVYSKLQTVKDYSVDANVKVDMPFIRILPTRVKIYYKQKDKFKVISKSIAVVPRQGFDQISKIISDTESFTAVKQGEEKIGTVQTTIVSVIPVSDTSEVILGKFWIDPAKQVILKSQLTTRTNGTVVTEYIYGSQIGYGLPDKMTFLVDVKKFKIPKGALVNSDNTVQKNDNKGKENKKGKIEITLTNYLVNKGIPDSVFKK